MIQGTIEGADGILVTTGYVHDEFVCNMVDLPGERFLVLSCGIDVEEFHSSRDSAVAVRGLLSEPARIASMATAGRKRAEDPFDWRKLGARLEVWLQGLCRS